MDKHYDDNHAPVRSRILLVSGMYSFDFDVCSSAHIFILLTVFFA